MLKQIVKLSLITAALTLIFSFYSYSAQNVSAPGGDVSDAKSMLVALGGETAGWINDTGTVCLGADITLASPITVTEGNIIINGAGCIIKRGFAGGAMFTLRDGTLILGNSKNTDIDDTLVINGGGEAYTEAGTVIAQIGGTLDFYNGTSVENNHASQSDGGAITIGGGTLNLYGGYIRGCSAVSGGGILMSDGTLNFTGGQIKNCTASQNGGGIYVTGGLLNMTGGTVGATVITEEYATEPVVESDAGNNAANGGGICIGGGSHCISGGVIAGNKAEYGGGVTVQAESELILYGGGIVYNNAVSGGGVYNEGKVTHVYAEIAKNKADEGGGIKNAEKAGYYMQDGTISSNTSAKDGAGISNNGTFEMTGGSVNYNESALSGGGLVNLGSFRLSGGSFGYNKATNIGKGMLCYSSGSVIFANAVFIGGDNDIALIRQTDTNAVAFLTLEGAFTCTTKVAKLTPVIMSGGSFIEDYKKGRILMVTAENNEQGMDYYIPLFDVSKDSTGGAWHITSDGTLARDLPGVWFWVTTAAVVLFIAGGIVFVVKARRKK